MISNKLFAISIFLFSLVYVTCPMAKNIYSNPDLSKTSKKFEGFTIDFRGIDTPDQTYWALCNWNMDLTDFRRTHPNAEGGGAYGGLQTKLNGEKVSILSFWEVLYKEGGVEKSHRATRMYPVGDESSFGGEGEGTNFIYKYDWPTNVWHRYVLRSWLDSNGDTFVGQWIQNLSNNEWTLFAYFNTKLKNSYIIGELSQFQENFDANYFGEERSFHIKNMYAFDKSYQKWISLATSTLSYDPSSWGYNTAGTHDIGYTTNYFYGSSGIPVDNQKVYDDRNPPKVGTISQPATPNFSKPQFDFLNIGLNSNYMTIFWRMNSKTTPCYKYEIKIYNYKNNAYKLLHTYISYKPEDNKYVYSSYFGGKYQVSATCYSISNDLVTTTAYKEL